MTVKNVFFQLLLWLALLLNVGILTKFILFKVPPGSYPAGRHWLHPRVKHTPLFRQKNTVLFASIKRIAGSDMSSTYKWKNIGGNIAGFIPLGFLLPLLLFRSFRLFKAVAVVFLLSLSFESIQLYTGCGVFDVDDLFLNTLGGLLGSLFFFIARSLFYPPPAHVSSPRMQMHVA